MRPRRAAGSVPAVTQPADDGPDKDDPSPLVMSLTPINVVTQPGSVKLVHRSGRVLHVFTGPSMLADGRALIDQLCAVFDDKRRIAREVEMRKPWWRFFW